jgi:hypothetical protein
VTAAAYTVVIVVLLGCCAYAASVLPGHQRLACLPRTLAIQAATTLIRAAITAIQAAQAARHLTWWARYARTRRHPVPGPGRDDGEDLTREELQVLGNLEAGRDVRART